MFVVVIRENGVGVGVSGGTVGVGVGSGVGVFVAIGIEVGAVVGGSVGARVGIAVTAGEHAPRSSDKDRSGKVGIEWFIFGSFCQLLDTASFGTQACLTPQELDLLGRSHFTTGLC
jgi:hypothetical protein